MWSKRVRFCTRHHTTYSTRPLIVLDIDTVSAKGWGYGSGRCIAFRKQALPHSTRERKQLDWGDSGMKGSSEMDKIEVEGSHRMISGSESAPHCTAPLREALGRSISLIREQIRGRRLMLLCRSSKLFGRTACRFSGHVVSAWSSYNISGPAESLIQGYLEHSSSRFFCTQQ
jgi:hypothetical protein